MSLFKKLIEQFSDIEMLPIEITEVRDAILDLGVQDQIHIVGNSADTAKVWGAYYKFSRHPGVYAAPELHSIIAYNLGLSIEWQRVVCCKELVHIFDRDEERTNTPEHVVELAAKLLGPMSSEDFGIGEIMALKDKIAMYQSLPLLFPNAARSKALAAIAAGTHDAKSIAKQAVLPLSIVTLILSKDWPAISSHFLDDC